MPLRLSVTAEGAMFPASEQHRLLDIARAAEDLGVDVIDTTEHVLMGLGALQSGQGWEMHHLEQPQPEALVTLAAMAGATKRIGILSSIVIAPLRPAGLLAKQVASLHALSQGRFTLGVTTSWHRDEYDALGVEYQDRGRLLDETIGACRALWSSAPAAFHGKYVNFDGMFCSPRPGPGERIQVWFGGKFTPRQIRRIVQLGDGWMPFGGHRMSVPQKTEAIATLRARFAEAGRDPASLQVCDGLRQMDSIAETMDQIPDLAGAGVTMIRVHLRRVAPDADHVFAALEEVVRRFEPMRALRV